MRAQLALLLLLTAGSMRCHALPNSPPKALGTAVAAVLEPGPFDFREVYLLERMIAKRGQAKPYDPNHTEETQSRTFYGLANPQLKNFSDRRHDLQTYAGFGWTRYVAETDGYREMGGLQLAEMQYLEILGFLRKAQGPTASDVSLMLDHLAEFYLEERNFAKAYESFTQALEVRRKSLNTSTCPATLPAGGTPESIMSPQACRLHLSDLLTRLAQMDLGKGDVKQAEIMLSEAVGIVNEVQNLRYTDGLSAIYFLSISLERQSRWKEAESLWTTSIKLREGLTGTAAYWDAEREMAAFHARHADFQAGAQIAARVLASNQARVARPQTYHTPLDNRPNASYEQYRALSDLAMNEIIAMDTWQTAGTETASSLLKDIGASENQTLLTLASDAELTEILAWLAKRVYLHMSILLDGEPTQARIDRAYTLLSEVKGSYLATSGQVSQLVQYERGNPGISGAPELPIRDQLAVARDLQSRLFLDVAVDHKPYDPVQFAINDNKLRILSTALARATEYQSNRYFFAIPTLSKAIPPGGAFLDFVAWQRTMRRGSPEIEYSVFVLRNGASVRHIRLGPVGPIDRDIDALHPVRKPGTLQRSMQVGGKELAPSVPVDWSHLGGLYQKVMAPLEGQLDGATDLYIAPDGKLAMAPFSALQTQNRYLLESHSVTYVVSWRDMMPRSEVNKWSSPPVVVANPDFNLDLTRLTDRSAQRFGQPPALGLKGLGEANAEADDVAKILGLNNERVLTGVAARKRLVQSLRSPGILHLATHSVANTGWTPPVPEYRMFDFPQPLDTQFPMLQSLIAFAGANRPQEGEEDGLMTGLEASSLNLLGTTLVVLSSCESGRGSTLDGQGVLGLRAAFSTAGGSAMVMTLWPVDDAAGRQLMDFFYRHLMNDTASPARALRLAQMDMQRSVTYADPFYWAGYLASGYPIVEPAKKTGMAAAQMPSPPEDQIFKTPNCYQILLHTLRGQDLSSTEIRITVGGIVRRSQNSPQQAVYSLQDTGNQVEVRTRTTVNGTLIDGSEHDILASERDWVDDVIVEKQKDFSSVSFRFGPRRAEPARRRTITLKGEPSLLPNLDLPSALPPLSAYLKLTDSQTEQIDSVGFCKASDRSPSSAK